MHAICISGDINRPANMKQHHISILRLYLVLEFGLTLPSLTVNTE